MTKPDPRRRHSVTFSTPEEKTLVMRKLREKLEPEIERGPHAHPFYGTVSDTQLAVEALRRAAGLTRESPNATDK